MMMRSLYRPVAQAPPCSTCPVGGKAQQPTTLLLKERKKKNHTPTFNLSSHQPWWLFSMDI